MSIKDNSPISCLDYEQLSVLQKLDREMRLKTSVSTMLFLIQYICSLMHPPSVSQVEFPGLQPLWFNISREEVSCWGRISCLTFHGPEVKYFIQIFKPSPGFSSLPHPQLLRLLPILTPFYLLWDKDVFFIMVRSLPFSLPHISCTHYIYAQKKGINKK